MPFQTQTAQLTVEKSGHIAVIRLLGTVADPKKLMRMSGELTDACTEIAADPGVRVVVLADGEKTNSFSEFQSIPKADRWPISELLAGMGQPLIAAIHGDSIGRGLEMVLTCDMRFASETSRFGLPQIKNGLIPWDGGTQRLMRLVGAGKAMELILTGDPIPAREAERIGLVNRLIPGKDIMDVAEKTAREMASRGPIALRYAKEAIGKGMDLTLDQGLRLEADLYFLLHTTTDRTEGIRAFQEKRTPDFEGK